MGWSDCGIGWDGERLGGGWEWLGFGKCLGWVWLEGDVLLGFGIGLAWDNEREEGKGGRKERAEGEMNRGFDGKEWEWIGRVGCGERGRKGGN